VVRREAGGKRKELGEPGTRSTGPSPGHLRVYPRRGVASTLIGSFASTSTVTLASHNSIAKTLLPPPAN